MHEIRRALWNDVDPYKYAINDKQKFAKLDGFHLESPVLQNIAREGGNILEVGTHRGASSVWMALQSPAVHVLTIDSWNLPKHALTRGDRMDRYAHSRQYFLSCVASRGLCDQITYLPMPSNRAFEVIRERIPDVRFRAAYIDGGHEYDQARTDIENAMKITTGPIVVDDYDVRRFPGVVAAVKAVSNRFGYKVQPVGEKAIMTR